MNHEHLVSEFLDEMKQRAEKHCAGRLAEAFIHWFVEAEYGAADWKFTDDARDGGIDAVVYCNDESQPVIFIQSKFSEKIGRSPLGASAYVDLARVVNAFRYGDERLDELLEPVRTDLKHIYRRAHKKLADLDHWARQKRAFRLITTCSRRATAEFSEIPRDSFIYAEDVLDLYKQYRNTFTPKARDLQLSVRDKLSYYDPGRKLTSYLFNARLSEFKKYLERNDVARLVARNIRYNLGGKVGQRIRTSYEKKPADFWYLHNGLTIICDSFFEEDQVATLTNPSVVNGAQTLYAIAGASGRDSSALVTTRVIVRGTNGAAFEDDDWTQRIIQGVNTQNRVRSADFRSNDPEQVELQKRFRELRVFYERKRGEWREVRNEPKYRGFDRVSLQTIAQVLCVTSEPDGSGVLHVKRGTDTLFDEKLYRQLFPSKSKIGFRFKRIYLAYRVYKLLNKAGYRSAKEWRTQRHAFWNTLWVLYTGLAGKLSLSGISVEAINNAFNVFESQTARGRLARKLVHGASQAVWRSYRTGRKVDPEKWTPNNFFKTKYGIKTTARLALPRVKLSMKKLLPQLQVES